MGSINTIKSAKCVGKWKGRENHFHVVSVTLTGFCYRQGRHRLYRTLQNRTEAIREKGGLSPKKGYKGSIFAQFFITRPSFQKMRLNFLAYHSMV